MSLGLPRSRESVTECQTDWQEQDPHDRLTLPHVAGKGRKSDPSAGSADCSDLAAPSITPNDDLSARSRKSDSKQGAHRCGPAVQAKSSGAPVKHKWKRKCDKCVADNLVKVEWIYSKVVSEKGRQHFIAGCQVNWREGRGVHVDTRLPQEDGLMRVEELSESSVKIGHIILIRLAHKESRNCVGEAQNQQKEVR